MTVTEPDIVAIKNEIITILKTNAEIWQEDNHEKGFQAINLELPVEAEFMGLSYPICFVANDNQLENDKVFGPAVAGQITGSTHEFQFRILFFEQGAESAEVEISLDGYYKQIKQTLKENHALNSVQGVRTSFPHRGHSFNFGEFEGKAIDGRVIILKVTVDSN